MDLSREVAIVPGGGTGIGKEIAQLLAVAGSHVVVHNARAATDALATAQERATNPVKVLPITAYAVSQAAVIPLIQCLACSTSANDPGLHCVVGGGQHGNTYAASQAVPPPMRWRSRWEECPRGVAARPSVISKAFAYTRQMGKCVPSQWRHGGR